MDHRHTVLSTGRSYHYLDQSPENKTTLLCIHGFPDFSYGWRNQIQPWVEAGYRVVVPDMPGYGETDMPTDPSAYSTKRLSDDLAALLDHIGVEKAVVIGHDWGSFIASRFALWHSQRLLALVLLSIPYVPPLAQYVSVDQLAERYPPYGYQVYFASEQSTAEIEANLPLFFRTMFRLSQKVEPPLSHIGQLQKYLLEGVARHVCILDDKELEYYVSSFKRGMLGPLSYYRTSKFRFEEESAAALPSKLRSDLPVLFLYGTEDETCPPLAVQNMDKFIDQLKIMQIPGAGHWIMIQAQQTVTEVIPQWLSSTLRSSRL